MKNKKQKKAGFTLVELMVVAIIVAILAAVAIPMMSRSQINSAIQTEGQTGCSAIATQIKVYYAANGAMPTALGDLSDYIDTAALQGSFFDTYTLGTMTDTANFTITATGRSDSKADGKTLTMTVSSGETTFSYTDTVIEGES